MKSNEETMRWYNTTYLCAWYCLFIR